MLSWPFYLLTVCDTRSLLSWLAQGQVASGIGKNGTNLVFADVTGNERAVA